MFFRREVPKQITFDQRMEELRKAGFTVTPMDSNRDGGHRDGGTRDGGSRDGGSRDGGTRVTVSRGGYAAVLENAPAGPRVAERAGVLMPGGIGKLVDAGFQKFFLAPGGRKKPALASELKALHAFQEDLREALGLVSLYNEALGTVSTEYLYDRVQDRDRGAPKRPWE